MSVHVGWHAVTDTITVRDEDGGEAEFSYAEWAEFLDRIRNGSSAGLPSSELRPPKEHS